MNECRFMRPAPGFEYWWIAPWDGAVCWGAAIDLYPWRAARCNEPTYTTERPWRKT